MFSFLHSLISFSFVFLNSFLPSSILLFLLRFSFTYFHLPPAPCSLLYYRQRLVDLASFYSLTISFIPSYLRSSPCDQRMVVDLAHSTLPIIQRSYLIFSLTVTHFPTSLLSSLLRNHRACLIYQCLISSTCLVLSPSPLFFFVGDSLTHHRIISLTFLPIHLLLFLLSLP